MFKKNSQWCFHASVVRSAVAHGVYIDKGGGRGRSSIRHRDCEGVVPKPAERVAALRARSGGEGRRVDEDVGLRVEVEVGHEELLVRSVPIVGARVGRELTVRLLKEEFPVRRFRNIFFELSYESTLIIVIVVAFIIIRKTSGRSTKVGRIRESVLVFVNPICHAAEAALVFHRLKRVHRSGTVRKVRSIRKVVDLRTASDADGCEPRV